MILTLMQILSPLSMYTCIPNVPWSELHLVSPSVMLNGTSSEHFTLPVLVIWELLWKISPGIQTAIQSWRWPTGRLKRLISVLWLIYRYVHIMRIIYTRSCLGSKHPRCCNFTLCLWMRTTVYYFTTLLYISYCIVLYYTVLYFTIIYSTIHYILLYYIILILYCIILFMQEPTGHGINVMFAAPLLLLTSVLSILANFFWDKQSGLWYIR